MAFDSVIGGINNLLGRSLPYLEGELLWIVTDRPVIYEGADMEPLVTPDGKQVVFRGSFDNSLLLND